jgi:hypothetical protein
VEAGLNIRDVSKALLDPFLFTAIEYVRTLTPSSAVIDIWIIVEPVAFSVIGPDVTPLATVLPSIRMTAFGSEVAATTATVPAVTDTEVW